MSEVQRAFLRRLRDADAEGLPASSVPTRCVSLVEQLQTCGAVATQLGKGRGFRLHLRDRAAFASYLEAHYPVGLDVADNDLVDRASAVALLGDAKAVRQGSHEGVFLRSAKPEVAVERAETAGCVPVGMLTATAGGAAIVLTAGTAWRFSGVVAVIENAEAFWRYEQVLPEVDLAIYAQGRMSERKLAWLSSPAMAPCRFVHWGDYDPVGVAEYRRLTVVCPGRVRLFEPPGIEQLLAKCGKRELITDQTDVLDSLRDGCADPAVARAVDWFDRYGQGLEQEVFLHLAGR